MPIFFNENTNPSKATTQLTFSLSINFLNPKFSVLARVSAFSFFYRFFNQIFCYK